MFSETSKKKSRKITQEVKDKVWNRDQGKCIECGSNEKLEFDHIIPFLKVAQIHTETYSYFVKMQ